MVELYLIFYTGYFMELFNKLNMYLRKNRYKCIQQIFSILIPYIWTYHRCKIKAQSSAVTSPCFLWCYDVVSESSRQQTQWSFIHGLYGSGSEREPFRSGLPLVGSRKVILIYSDFIIKKIRSGIDFWGILNAIQRKRNLWSVM